MAGNRASAQFLTILILALSPALVSCNSVEYDPSDNSGQYDTPSNSADENDDGELGNWAEVPSDTGYNDAHGSADDPGYDSGPSSEYGSGNYVDDTDAWDEQQQRRQDEQDYYDELQRQREEEEYRRQQQDQAWQEEQDRYQQQEQQYHEEQQQQQQDDWYDQQF